MKKAPFSCPRAESIQCSFVSSLWIDDTFCQIGVITSLDANAGTWDCGMTACDKREELNVVGTHVVTNVGVVLGVVLIRDLLCLPAFPALRSHMCRERREGKFPTPLKIENHS